MNQWHLNIDPNLTSRTKSEGLNGGQVSGNLLDEIGHLGASSPGVINRQVVESLNVPQR